MCGHNTLGVVCDGVIVLLRLKGCMQGKRRWLHSDRLPCVCYVALAVVGRQHGPRTARPSSSSSSCRAASSQQACGPPGRALWWASTASSTNASTSSSRTCQQQQLCTGGRHIWRRCAPSTRLRPTTPWGSACAHGHGSSQWLASFIWQLRPARCWAHGAGCCWTNRVHLCTLLGFSGAQPCSQHGQHLLYR